MNLGKCETCKYYSEKRMGWPNSPGYPERTIEERTETMGSCHRRAPMTTGTLRSGEWPYTTLAESCGEWEASRAVWDLFTEDQQGDIHADIGRWPDAKHDGDLFRRHQEYFAAGNQSNTELERESATRSLMSDAEVKQLLESQGWTVTPSRYSPHSDGWKVEGYGESFKYIETLLHHAIGDADEVRSAP